MTDRDGLRKLRYSDKWVDYGFLDEETLRRQLLIFDTGEDSATEHYRYAAFCAVLERDGLSDVDLDRLLELASEEPDPETADAVRNLVLWWPKLTPSQRSRLRTRPDFAEGRLQREFRIFDLTQELHASTAISDDLLDRCLATGDETLQRQIVEHHGVTRQHLNTLIERGKSKAVRNMAQSRMNRQEGPREL